jgi:hypothetical protein
MKIQEKRDIRVKSVRDIVFICLEFRRFIGIILICQKI